MQAEGGRQLAATSIEVVSAEKEMLVHPTGSSNRTHCLLDRELPPAGGSSRESCVSIRLSMTATI